MTTKILSGNKDYPDVHIGYHGFPSINKTIEITAFGTINGLKDEYLREEQTFATEQATKSFLQYFTRKSAHDWCRENKITA